MYVPPFLAAPIRYSRPLFSEQILPYSQLLENLQISSIRELEDLIIDAIYLEVIRGKLDQKEQQFKVAC